tara:strand:- start:492 stop:737 length:246 start_codon:yes stop_codon:yes gene_type:complete
MVHAIKTLKCKKGHHLPIQFDSNECGCHHDGKPCIIFSCRTCFEEALKEDDTNFNTINIPLDEDSLKELEKFTDYRGNTHE